MQNVSKNYKESMKAIGRNRGYIRATIGIINSNAQENVALDARTKVAYFSDIKKPFDSYTVDNVYATAEQDFSHVDGTMYFLPKKSSGMSLYNNGIVTQDILGSVYISFQDVLGLDIKGLTIDFGEYYPVDFSIQNDSITRFYSGNDKRYFMTEDVFNGTSYFIITPSKMVNGQCRLRIYQFFCGIVNSFTNKEVKNFSSKEHVSSITDTIPSMDISLTVDNQNLYYSPDNPESAFAYFEIGQELKVSFGYDVLGDGNIEWLPESTAYLKNWTANDKEAKFTATDRFDYLTSKYYRGLYRKSGISLYDLAVDVLTDAGITDRREYFIDPYLKDIVVYNPLPVVKHSEALQIIANAGRCALYEDRQSRIHFQASFIPDMVASSNGETAYSNIESVLIDDKKDGYAITSNDFSVVDGSVFFMPKDMNYLNVGYVSEQIGDLIGNFSTNPVITIQLEAAFVAYGILIRFRNVAPQEFVVRTYNEDILVSEYTVYGPDLEYITHEQFDLFDKMQIEFTRGYPNARVTIDNILIGDVTDYVLKRNDLFDSPTANRQEKIKSITVVRSIYKESTEEIKELSTQEIVLSSDTEYTVNFSKPSYGLVASIVNNENLSVEIIECSSYFAKLKITGITSETVVKYSIIGYEYVVEKSNLTIPINENGQEISWCNPLVSDTTHAKDLEEWLSSYYLGDVDYQIKWRGDPRTDANDLFYLELKDRPNTMIRCYQNELKFNGAWSGTMKARKAVL